MGVRSIGARVERQEDENLVTGQGQFVDDIHLPGMLHATFLRSPHAHARIRSIDARAALAMPGVHAVLTAEDLPRRLGSVRMPMLVPNTALAGLITQYCLAAEEVCYVGEAIAIVLADSRYEAEDAAAAVEIDCGPLGVVSDCHMALTEGAPRVHLGAESNLASKFKLAYGDIDAAFAAAPHVFREELWQHRGGGNALECRGVVARFDRVDKNLTVWSATQTPHISKRMLAEILELDAETVRVIATDVGGGFGPKAIFYGEEAAIAAAAIKLKRPVKWIEDRREHFLTATQERDQYWTIELATEADGRIRGVRCALLHDTGAYVPWGIIMPYIAGATVPGPYVLPAYEFTGTVVFTNRVATTPVRGAGRPQAVFAMERAMDRAAHELGLDPAEIRRRNFIKPTQMPYAMGIIFRDGKPLVYDSGDYPACQEKALALAKYESFVARQAKARAAGRHIGIGIANYVEGTGLGPFEGVTVRIQESGKVTVNSGSSAQGQGHKTTFAQLVAERLGVAMDDIIVTIGDTKGIAMGMGAFASRIAVNAGNSAAMAADNVRAQVLKLAARVFEAKETDLVIADGRVKLQTGNRPSLGFGELARIAQGMPGFSFPAGQQSPGLEHTAYFTPSQAAYCNGCHVAEVEVDIATGFVRVLDYVVAHDSGTILNPLIVDGQVQGGVAHGIGNALFEWMMYDENGQPLTTNFGDYLLPMAADVPKVAQTHMESPSPFNPLGVKGAGEGGTIPAAAAIIAAIENALAPFDVKLTTAPTTPEKIVELLSASSAYDPFVFTGEAWNR
jgi:aerobic carbon-monoxide dehydrogenase large subunit